MIRALLIDDDVRFSSLLVEYLAAHEVRVTHAPDGGRGLAALDSGAFDVVLLDIMMPGMDGLEVLRRVRGKSAVPVLMLTARGDETDRVVGLELGADDYVSKPASPRELLARIRAVLRRASGGAASEKVQVAHLEIDVAARTAVQEGNTLDLTGLEFDLLLALAKRAGRVVPRSALLELAGRGDITVGERTVDVHISHLRAKLGDDPRAPRRIKTVRGVGYVLAKDEP